MSFWHQLVYRTLAAMPAYDVSKPNILPSAYAYQAHFPYIQWLLKLPNMHFLAKQYAIWTSGS